MRVIELDETTRIPLRIVAVVLSVTALGAVWVGVQTFRIDNAEGRLDAVEKIQSAAGEDSVNKREAIVESLNEIKIRLARIESKMERNR